MSELLKKGLIISVLIVLMGCGEDDDTEQKNYKIEFGSECGWCAGQEFITVTASEIKYLRNIPCGDGKGSTNKVRKVSSTEWEKLTSSFDFSLFKTLNYNTCNVCADGCDEIIKITENDSTHELRYSVSDEVDGMQNLQQILKALLEEMRAIN